MLKLSLKNLWSHKIRLISTFLAVSLGVAFLSGTLVLGDTMRATFSDLFSSANQGTDAVVRGKAIDADFIRQPSFIPDSLLADVRDVEGVATAEPVVEGFGQLVATDGGLVGGLGPPTAGGNWIDDEGLNPYQLEEGRLPRTSTEVVINRGAADSGGLKVGDTATLQTPEPVEVEIVGLSSFGAARADSSGGMTFTAFTLEGAQEHVTKKPGELSSISIAADQGVSQTELVKQLEPVLPDGIEAITGEALTEEQKNDINSGFLDAFSIFLTIFAVIALLVATFSIYNTFSIIVAQRSREWALLRAIGASRGQVLRATGAEAVLVGVVASIVGLGLGMVFASGLKALFDALGFGVPAAGLSFTTTTLITPLIVGLAVTVVAGFLPAIRASRIPPMAALRDVAVEGPGASTIRIVIGGVLTAIGVALVLANAFKGDDAVFAQTAFGAVATIIGVVVLGPVAARPTARVIGAPLPRLRGFAGLLARENAMRNPRRTSGTAAALMIGVGVVTLFTVFAASIKASIDQSVNASFGGDLVVSINAFGGGFTPQLATDVAELPDIAAAAGLGLGAAEVGGKGTMVTVADPSAMGQVLDLGVVAGSLDELGDSALAVSEQKADSSGWKVGDTVKVDFADRTSADFTVGAVYTARDIAGDVLIPRAAWTPHATQDLDTVVLIKVNEGVELAAAKAEVEKIAQASAAGAQVQDRQEYADTVTAGINGALQLVYVMLALAIGIAFMGIANTLSLAIHERTRELGLLRAVGETRSQVRAMVRWESVIIALFGTLGGLSIGVFLGWALVKASASEGLGVFSAPPGQLVAIFVVAAFAGVAAALLPARKAAKLDILKALATG